ncbi:hypothetical protein D3C73_1411000 [compost metagenome]
MHIIRKLNLLKAPLSLINLLEVASAIRSPNHKAVAGRPSRICTQKVHCGKSKRVLPLSRLLLLQILQNSVISRTAGRCRCGGRCRLCRRHRGSPARKGEQAR